MIRTVDLVILGDGGNAHTAAVDALQRGRRVLVVLRSIIPLGERHFRQAIAEFVEHYHRERNLQGLDNRLNAGTPVTDRTGAVRYRRRLGGLLNFYERAA
jgi:hypothetical protein